MTNAYRDQNNVPTLIGVSSVDGQTPLRVYVDPTTHRVLVDSSGGGGSGTVTSVSVTTVNGVSGTVATPTTTPAITLTLGDIVPTSVNSIVLSGASTPTLAVTGTTTVSGANTGDQTSVSGNAGTATALQNARTIAGVSFNGTANIAIASTNLSDTASIALLTSTQTLTNKRITKRVLALSANSATPAINTDSYDVVHITAQTAAITSFTTNLTGTPVDGDTLRISVTGTGAVGLTFGTSFEASTVALPTTTVSTTRLDMGFFWNTETSKWRLVAQA